MGSSALAWALWLYPGLSKRANANVELAVAAGDVILGPLIARRGEDGLGGS